MPRQKKTKLLNIDARRTSIANEDPENFADEEFTTREAGDVQEMAQLDTRRTAQGARASGRNVQRVAKVKRGHTGSAAAALSAKQPLRENFPTEFVPTSQLAALSAPKGMTLRWIRFRLGDGQKPDVKNLSKKFRNGWRPFLAKDAPDNYMPPETANTQYGEAICSGDLLLCYMPAELKAKRDAYYRRKLQNRTKSVKDKVVGETGGAVEFDENKSRVTRGRRPQFQAEVRGEFFSGRKANVLSRHETGNCRL